MSKLAIVKELDFSNQETGGFGIIRSEELNDGFYLKTFPSEEAAKKALPRWQKKEDEQAAVEVEYKTWESGMLGKYKTLKRLEIREILANGIVGETP